MRLINHKPNDNYTVKQLKLPLVIEKLIDISDPVYTFCDVMDHIDLTPYFVEGKGYKTGRPRCDAEKLLKVILFAFMENGYCSLREIEKLCNNDIRFMYLLDEMKAPTFATFGNFIRNELTANIEDIFNDINSYIFDKEKVDFVGLTKSGNLIAGNYNKKQLSDLGAVEGLTFGPPLIINGEKVIKNGDGGWGISPRSAIGQKKDGTIMFLVIDGRQPGYSIGATLVDAQNMMYENGAYIAANLDGGSSTTLYYNGKVVNKPADLLGERMIPTAFIVK